MDDAASAVTMHAAVTRPESISSADQGRGIIVPCKPSADHINACTHARMAVGRVRVAGVVSVRKGQS